MVKRESQVHKKMVSGDIMKATINIEIKDLELYESFMSWLIDGFNETENLEYTIKEHDE